MNESNSSTGISSKRIDSPDNLVVCLVPISPIFVLRLILYPGDTLVSAKCYLKSAAGVNDGPDEHNKF